MSTARRFALAAALAARLATGAPAETHLPDAEDTVPGKLTTTEDQALYGVAILRAAPDADAAAVGKLIPGSAVTVFPETSPAGWWYIELTTPGGEKGQGFVPRSFVRINSGPFKDVPGDHWAAAALGRLKETGDISGYRNGRFQGDKAFTRFEMAVLLDRYLGRLKKSRAEIEARIAAIPVKAHLGGHDAGALDEVIRNLEALAKEEASLKEMMGAVRRRVDTHERRLDAMHDEFASVVSHDKAQDRRLDELARTAAELTEEVDSLRAAGKTYAKASVPSPRAAATMAGNLMKVKQLMARAESLESKVAALESRDRLADLLRREETKRATTGTRLAARAGGGRPGRM